MNVKISQDIMEKDNDWIFYFSPLERAQQVRKQHLSSCSLRRDYGASGPDYLKDSERHLSWTAVVPTAEKSTNMQHNS